MAEGRDVDAAEKFNREGPDADAKHETVNAPKAKPLNERKVQQDSPLRAEDSPKRKKTNPYRVEKTKDGKSVMYVDGSPDVTGAAGVVITEHDRVEFSNGLVVTTMKAKQQ